MGHQEVKTTQSATGGHGNLYVVYVYADSPAEWQTK